MQLESQFASEFPELCDTDCPRDAVPIAETVLSNSRLSQQWQLSDIDWASFCQQRVSDGSVIAQKYAGHQFGHFNPYLGDGRGLLLGEYKAPSGEWFDWHLKGAGTTAFSRGGDGRAVLRSCIREWLGSEAMASLGVASTRALALLSSGEAVQRERVEPGALLLRATPTHIRFGHFEHCLYRNLTDTAERLYRFTIRQNWPDLEVDDHQAWFNRVVDNTAKMIAGWQAFGFVHGVMNTDNMSILGETFDYGPYAFFDRYLPEKIFNHTDQNGRYRFDRQPSVALWNLQRLAQALALFMDGEVLSAGLASFETRLQQHYAAIMSQRLGLPSELESHVQSKLIAGWLALLEQQQADYTQSFWLLEHPYSDAALFTDEFGRYWLSEYQAAVGNAEQPQLAQFNPSVVARTHQLQRVINAAEQGDYQPLKDFSAALQQPFDATLRDSEWAQAPETEWPEGQLSCSS
ncbi:YdiU family protein [Idiomarina tyrosinivorans]|uniref:Protein nucleotidyltransferase YdiU n=1 Tax=Idiomarina tyrosinivorans TaxID=1445662 RepID=A0A432ZTE2_9GAMM|nr:YdiU family protein [Idiomarina tyrosinivorans]RUO81205.1 YdiU family protein [Idiomarina tyrosinivorans]